MSTAIPETMTVIELAQPGGPEVLRPETRPVPTPVAVVVSGSCVSWLTGSPWTAAAAMAPPVCASICTSRPPNS